MSGRDDIIPRGNNWRGLSYTRHCGWVDWGHALPGGANALKHQLNGEKSGFGLLDNVDVRYDGQPAFVISYGLSMGSNRVRIHASSTRHWIVRKGLTSVQKESVALAIFLSASHDFETMQSSFPFSWITDSGYSLEDLVSNLIGFIGAYRSIPMPRLRQICGEVSVQESLRIWDKDLPKGIGSIKNRTTQPRYFSTSQGGNAKPAMPPEFSQIRPARKGVLWTKLAGGQRFLDGYLVGSGSVIHIDRNGNVRQGQRREQQESH